MPFVGGVVVREIDDETWELIEPLRYSGKREEFTVPDGFQTDFASVPRAFVWLIPRYGRYTKAAILHDFLCEEAKAGRFNRDDADGIFRRAMRELGVPFLRRWIMWGAVALATQWLNIREIAHRYRGLRRFAAWWRRFWAWRFALLLIVAVPAAMFFAIPAVVVTVWLALFWIAELVTFAALKPVSRKKQVNRPRFTWRMS